MTVKYKQSVTFLTPTRLHSYNDNPFPPIEMFWALAIKGFRSQYKGGTEGLCPVRGRLFNSLVLKLTLS